MKKTFVEPSMRKIELNLSENIAESSSIVEIGFIFWYHWIDCTVQHTGRLISQGAPVEDLQACYADGTSSTSLNGRTVVPEERFRMFIRY